MTATNYLMNVRASLDAVADLIHEAADNERPVNEIAEEALARLHDAMSVIDTLREDEGTE